MYHTDKDWVTYPISTMKESHLLNTIGFFIKQIKHSKKILDGGWLDSIEGIALGVDSDDAKEYAKRSIKKFMEVLPDYVFEATVRWLDTSPALQSLLWRSARALVPASDLMLPLPDKDDEEDLF